MTASPPPPRPLSLPRRIVRGAFAVLAALWMVVEEWLWDGLVRLTKWIAKLPVFRAIEARIRGCGPKTAMALFAVPWLLLLPAKVLGLWLMGTGHFATGVFVFVVAKLLGTAMLARLFTLTRPALLQIGWFRRLYGWFTGLRDRLYAYVKSLRAYQATRRWLSAARTWLRALWPTRRRAPKGS
ncbi:MAG: hypothetical protein JNK15_18245 [Planctomycetes bacterium]|nr:hypothetical protein [Planctomycetota bacterium]